MKKIVLMMVGAAVLASCDALSGGDKNQLKA